jgi:hypothetical protein
VAHEIWEVKDKQVEKLDMSIEEYKQTLVAESSDAVANAISKARG